MKPILTMPRPSRRSLLKTSVAAGGASLVGRGAIQPAAASRQDFGGSLTVWGVVSFTEEGDELLGQQMRDWGEANGVEVEYVALPGSDYATRVATAVESGAVPDVVMMIYDLTIFYANQDRLVDLTDLFEELNQLEGGIWLSLLSHVQADGRTYSIPMEADVSVMYSRLDLIEEVTGERIPPTTMDELEEMAREITDPPRQFGIGLSLGRAPDTEGQITQLIFNDGGTLVDESGAPALASEGAVTALTRVKRWWDDGLIPPDSPGWDDSSNNTSYQSYISAFVFNPASILGYLEANDPELLANTAQAPYPAGEAGSFPTAGTWSWAIFNESENVEAGTALIRHLMQPENLQAVYEEVGGRWYPAYVDIQNEPFWTERPAFEYFPQILEDAREMWYPAEGTPLLITQLSAVSQRLVLSDLAQAVTVDGADPEQAVQEAQVAMEQIFEEVAANE